MKEKKRASNTSSRFSLLMGLNVSIFFSNISPKIKECTVLHVLTWGFGIQKLDQDYPQAKETPISSYTTQISTRGIFALMSRKFECFYKKKIIKVSEILNPTKKMLWIVIYLWKLWFLTLGKQAFIKTMQSIFELKPSLKNRTASAIFWIILAQRFIREG